MLRTHILLFSDSLAFRFGAFQFVTKINLRIEIDEFARAARPDRRASAKIGRTGDGVV